MQTLRRWACCVVWAGTLAACSESPSVHPDASAGRVDAALPAVDAGRGDAEGVRDAGDTRDARADDAGDAGGATPTLRAGGGFTEPTPEPPPRGSPSERGYEEWAIARWAVVPFQTYVPPATVSVVADHIAGIDRVEFSLDGGPWTAVAAPSLDPGSGVMVYAATVDPAALTDGAHSVRAVVIPRVGRARVLGGAFFESLERGDYALDVFTNAGGGLPAEEVFVATSGDDEAGDGSRAHPFRTLARAAFALAGEAHLGDADGGTIFLEAGDYDLGTYTFARQIRTTRYLRVTAAPGVDRESVRIVSASDGGLRTDRVLLENLTIAPRPDVVGVLRSDNHGVLWLDRVKLTSQSFEGSSTHTWSVGWRAKFFTGCEAFNVRGTPYTGVMVASSTIDLVADDAFKNIAVVLDVEARRLGLHGTDHHPDVWQVWNANATVENTFVDGLRATSAIEAQGLFFHGFTREFRDCAFRNVTIDNSNDGAGTVFVNLHMGRPVRHLLLRDSVLITGGLYRTGDDPSTPDTSHSIFSATNMLIESSFSDAAREHFLIPPPDGPSALGPGSWPGTLPWTSPLGVHYEE